jgi:hypothetical protein
MKTADAAITAGITIQLPTQYQNWKISNCISSCDTGRLAGSVKRQ